MYTIQIFNELKLKLFFTRKKNQILFVKVVSGFQFKDADQEKTYGQVKKQGDSNTLKCNKKNHLNIIKY